MVQASHQNLLEIVFEWTVNSDHVSDALIPSTEYVKMVGVLFQLHSLRDISPSTLPFNPYIAPLPATIMPLDLLSCVH